MKNSNQDDAVVRMLNQVEGLLKKERDTLRSAKPDAETKPAEAADWREEVGWNEPDNAPAKDAREPVDAAAPDVVAIEDAPSAGAQPAPPLSPIQETAVDARKAASGPVTAEASQPEPEPTAEEPSRPEPEPVAVGPAAPAPTPQQPTAAPSPEADVDDAYTGRRLTTRLGQLLLDQNLISESDLQKALAEQQESGDRLGGILVSGGYVGEAELLAVLVKQHGVPAADLDNAEIPPDVADLIPAEMARRYLVVPLAVRHGAVDLAMVDPTDFVALAHLRFATGMRPNVFITTVTAAQRAIARLYGAPASAGKAPGEEPLPDDPHEAVKKMILDRDAMLMGAESDPRKFYQLAASIDDFIDRIFRIARGA